MLILAKQETFRIAVKMYFSGYTSLRKWHSGSATYSLQSLHLDSNYRQLFVTYGTDLPRVRA